MGDAKVTCYVFKSKIDGKAARESRDSIEREFFKNNMVVLFSLNGQVHGHYGSEFITRTLKMPLLKNHLLIHVDCTHMHYRFRKELFMASRDRLEGSEETSELRDVLARTLAGGKLAELHKRRKDAISIEESDTSDLIKAFTRSMPLDSDLMKLLESTFKLNIPEKKQPKHTPAHHEKKEEADTPFVPQRFPSFFRLQGSGSEERPAAQVPLGGSRTVKFETDVENQYFDRSNEPGDVQLSLLTYKSNISGGGTAPGQPKQLSSLLNVTRSSPDKGKIRIVMNPATDAQVGDLIQVKACLTGPGTERCSSTPSAASATSRCGRGRKTSTSATISKTFSPATTPNSC